LRRTERISAMSRNDIPGAGNLRRPIHVMTQDIRHALEHRGLMARYRARPAYQQNDYVGWINRARKPQTRKQRLNQMIEELEGGTLYMEMKWQPKKRV
jgi:hypothetical protein